MRVSSSAIAFLVEIGCSDDFLSLRRFFRAWMQLQIAARSRYRLRAFSGLLIGHGRHQRGLLGFLRIRVELVDPLEYLCGFGAAAAVEFCLSVLIHHIRRTGIERARIAAAKQGPH
jgi:hypothetical protein